MPLTPRNGTDGLAIAGTWTTLNVHAGLLDVGDGPRAGDPERRLRLGERGVTDGVVGLRVDQAFLVPLVDQLRVLDERRVRDADVLRVQVPGLVGAEDVAAETREERVHVVRVAARALLDADAERQVVLLLGRERLALELREGRRDLGELRVHEQADVLDLHRDAVELLDGGAVRERVERVLRELRCDASCSG